MKSCATCAYSARAFRYEPSIPYGDEGVEPKKYEVVECRRRAPLAFYTEQAFQGRVLSVWPTMESDDWCGEYAKRND